MKRLILVSAVLLFATGVSFAVESGSVPTTEIPQVIEIIGRTGNLPNHDEVIEAAYFPIVTVKGEYDDECASILNNYANVSITRTPTKKTRQGEPIKTNLVSTTPIPISDLYTTVKILPAHQRSAKILVFWTVRVVGQCLPWQITNDICDYAQFTEFTCPANDVKTFVRVTDANLPEYKQPATALKKDNACILQIPLMTNNSNETDLFDPTITGTYVITKDDFPGGVIPSKVKIQIYWQNMGSLRVTSPMGLRNMIVNVLPYSKTDK